MRNKDKGHADDYWRDQLWEAPQWASDLGSTRFGQWNESDAICLGDGMQ